MADIIFDLANIIPLSLAVSFLLFSGHKGSLLLISVPVMISVLCVLFLHMKKRGRLVLSGIVISLAAGLFLVSGKEGRQAFAEGYLWTVYLSLFCIGIFMFEEAALRYRKLKLISCAGMFSAMIYMLFWGIQAGRTEVAMILFYLLMTAVEETGIRWKREGTKRTVPVAPSILPFLLFVLIILLFLKAPAKPYDWGFVKKAVKSARNAYEIMIARLELRDRWDSKDAVTGFSDRGGIGSSIRNRPYEALSLETDRVYDGRMYLSGRTFDTFDGREWRKTDDSDIDGRTYDLLLTCASIIRYDPDHVSDYIQRINTTVGYKGVSTKLLFAPLKSFPLADDGMILQRGEDLSFGKGKTSGYTVTGYRVNRSSEGFETFLRDHDDVDRMDLYAAEMKVLKKDLPEYSYEGLLEHKAHIREVYGQDPGLSDRMKEYLADVLEGAESDAEKLSVIEEILSGMKYDTDPGKISDEVKTCADFTDWFLFEKQAGYCVHYATAFVLLSRAAGIPARYVQGYSVKMSGRDRKIMSTDAHAWPEVYISGAGWTVYEPTPGYRVLTGWSTSSASGQGEASGSDPSLLYGKEVSLDEIPEALEDGSKKAFDPRKLFIPAVSVLVFLMLFIVGDRIIRRYRYKRMDERKKILYCAAISMKQLKKCNLVLQDGETLSEFEKRAESRIPGELLAHLELCERALYSNEAPGWKDVANAEAGSRELSRFIRKQKISKLFINRKDFSHGSFLA